MLLSLAEQGPGEEAKALKEEDEARGHAIAGT